MTSSLRGNQAGLCVACWLTAILSLAGDAYARQAELTVHAPPGLETIAQRVRRMDLPPLERSLAASGLPMPERITITLIASDDPRAQRAPQWIVGLAAGTSHIVIFPGRIGSYPPDSLETVVRHEIVHLALNTRALGRPMPRWFHEGTAVTVASGWRTRDEMRLLLAALDPPSIADIGRLFRSDAYPDTAQAYLLAAALVDHIRRHHGVAVAGTIAGHVAGGLRFDEAFQAATGETVERAAARAWQGHRTVAQWFLVITSPSAIWPVILALAVVAFVLRVRRRRALRRRWEEENEEEDVEP